MRSFNHTMDLLVRAYFNNTLEHGDCKACAVGNICNGSNGWASFFFTQSETSEQKKAGPDEILYMNWFGELDRMNASDEEYKKMRAFAEKTVSESGYTVEELARIEYAFETAPKGENEDDWMFNGLLAVLEVLADIHKVDFNGAVVYERRLAEIHASR